jgi:hypothetical protein
VLAEEWQSLETRVTSSLIPQARRIIANSLERGSTEPTTVLQNYQKPQSNLISSASRTHMCEYFPHYNLCTPLLPYPPIAYLGS